MVAEGQIPPDEPAAATSTAVSRAGRYTTQLARSAATAQAKRLADRAHQAQGRGRPRAFQLLQDLRHAESG